MPIVQVKMQSGDMHQVTWVRCKKRPFCGELVQYRDSFWKILEVYEMTEEVNVHACHSTQKTYASLDSCF